MDIAELEALVESQRTENEALKGTVADQGEQITVLKTGAGKVDQKEIDALTAKAARVDELEAANTARDAKDLDTELSALFPAIKDWSAVSGSTKEERTESAQKLVDMFKPEPTGTPEEQAAAKVKADAEAAALAKAKKDAADKGEEFKPVPGQGAPAGEAKDAEERNANIKQIQSASKDNDLLGVLDGCIKVQPKASETVFANARADK